MGSSSSPNRPAQITVILAFASIYLCWGATYTAMSIGVRLLPATILAGTRLMISACLLLAFCYFNGKKIFYSRGIMLRLGLLGLMLLFGGNVGLVWSEKYVASGLAALIVAVTPLWVAVIEELLPGGEQLRRRGVIGLMLGFFALMVLLWPGFHAALQTTKGSGVYAVALVVLVLGPLSFASGSVMSRRMHLPVDPFVAAGWEMMAAAIVDLFLATVTWQWPHAHWTMNSIGALAYLIQFGSLLGFSCYIWLIHHVPVTKVATYAFVNPVVAVILGMMFLNEHPHPSEFIGMMAVVGAVALVTSSQMKSGKPVAEVEVAPIEDKA
ncbi:MAG: EamA family transporter [Acidobacteriaceae bacterium]